MNRLVMLSSVILIVLIMLLSACAPNGRASDFCAVAKPIYIEDADVFTEATAREILIHNETGAKICGW